MIKLEEAFRDVSMEQYNNAVELGRAFDKFIHDYKPYIYAFITPSKYVAGKDCRFWIERGSTQPGRVYPNHSFALCVESVQFSATKTEIVSSATPLTAMLVALCCGAVGGGNDFKVLLEGVDVPFDTDIAAFWKKAFDEERIAVDTYDPYRIRIVRQPNDKFLVPAKLVYVFGKIQEHEPHIIAGVEIIVNYYKQCRMYHQPTTVEGLKETIRTKKSLLKNLILDYENADWSDYETKIAAAYDSIFNSVAKSTVK